MNAAEEFMQSELSGLCKSIRKRLSLKSDHTNGLEHAVDMILNSPPNDMLIIYEAGVLLCMSVFLQSARKARIFIQFVESFQARTKVLLGMFSHEFMWSYRNTERFAHAEYGIFLPETLEITMLPKDAIEYWQDHKDEVVRAVELIDLDESNMYDYVRHAVFLMNKTFLCGSEELIIHAIRALPLCED